MTRYISRAPGWRAFIVIGMGLAIATVGHAAVPAFTLAALRSPVARMCGGLQAQTIASMWQQVTHCPSLWPATRAVALSPGAAAPTGLDGSAGSIASTPAKFTPTPTKAGEVPAVASGVNIKDYLEKSWGTGNIPTSGGPDVVGAFRFICKPSHNSYDDPIVYPGQPGKAHLHTFFGNTKADAKSTYASLRASGESSCNNLLNRSAYWIPAMMNGVGGVVMPEYVSIYYKRRPSSDPFCQKEGKACVALPRGLRYIFGYNMQQMKPGGHFQFGCIRRDWSGTPSRQNLPEAAAFCGADDSLSGSISAPSCWNGTDLDSPDHQSHMAYPDYGSWGYLKCPTTHPYVVPTFTLTVAYKIDATLDRTGKETWYFSSDRMPGMAQKKPGTTFHADWFGAWEDQVMDMWTANCIEKLLNCSGGDLGNGWQLKNIADRTSPLAGKVVPAPIDPKVTASIVRHTQG